MTELTTRHINSDRFRLPFAIIAIAALFAQCGTAWASTHNSTVFFVSPTGHDSFPGTKAKPFHTIDRAKAVVQHINRYVKGDIIVYLRGGAYFLNNPVEFGPADSGFNGHKIVYEAYGQEKPVLCGGVVVKGWSLDHGSVYRAPLDRGVKLRSLFVNGFRAEMTSKAVQGQGPAGVFNVAGTEPWAESPGSGPDGIQFNTGDIGIYKNPQDVELDQQYTWNASIVGVRDIVPGAAGVDVEMQQPAGVLANSLGYGTGLNPSGGFTVKNAYELMDAPGQFYYDRSAHVVYYYSRGEDMSRAIVIAPTSSGLVRIAGQSTTSRVTGLVFKGLTFEFDDWQLMTIAGSHLFAGVQSAALVVKYRADSNWHTDKYSMCDLPQGTVDIRSAQNILLEGNIFKHLASGSAVCLVNDVNNTTIDGNIFYDLAGNAVTVGHPQHGYTDGSSTLFPVGTLGVCTNDIVSNNLLRKVSIDYHQLEGIAAFFVDGLQIVHNDIAGTPYDAITLGWGWSNQPNSTTCRNNTIGFNRVVDANRILVNDGGPIYTLGQQPNSRIIGNYVKNGPRQIYTDEGSGFFTIVRNVLENAGDNGKDTVNNGEAWYFAWTPTIHDVTIDGNYTDTDLPHDHGTNCPITNTHVEKLPWDEAASAIIANSGLEPNYRYLLTEYESTDIAGATQ